MPTTLSAQVILGVYFDGTDFFWTVGSSVGAPTGPTGAQGATGAGPQGATGVGPQGATGTATQGATGTATQGATGTATQGATGTATQGATGTATQGETGPQGATGADNSTQGATGADSTVAGPQGPDGGDGPQGADGTGSQGATGANSTVAGPQGPDGSQGATGTAGAVTAFTNGSNDRVVTATGASGINGEANLIFDATTNSLVVSSGGLAVGLATVPTTVGIGLFANDVVAYSSSDRRLKENIIPIPNALSKLMKINGVSFDWIPLTDKERVNIHPHEGHDIGIIAQEIEEVLPEVVTTRDTGFKAVKYEKIVALLIEAIKEQQVQIDQLKDK